MALPKSRWHVPVITAIVFLATLSIGAADKKGGSVDGISFPSNGRSRIPCGARQIISVVPPSEQKGVSARVFHHYFPTEYQRMRSQGIDSARTQVSWLGLEAENQIVGAASRTKAINAVWAARRASAQSVNGPSVQTPPNGLPQPVDRPFIGAIQLFVDATDASHAIFRVVEKIPLQALGDTVLLFPEWETASHAPTASVAELSGLQVQIDGKPAEWRRDNFNVHAFHVQAPVRAKTLTLVFQYLSLQTEAKLRPQMVDVQWHRLLLYPAGWYARNIPVRAKLRLRPGERAFTSLDTLNSFSPDADTVSFRAVMLDRLIDSPVYAGLYTRQIDLSSPFFGEVDLDLLADNPSDLEVPPSMVARLQAVITQSGKVFGPPPFRRYHILVSLSDVLSPGGGLEHLDEGENNLPSNFFSQYDQQLNNADLIAHEYVHAWNGRAHQPSGLWSPDFNHPTDPSLLWVYEGQTEFWGRVLAARSGLRTLQQTKDKIAMDAALVANRKGREWKSLEDSSFDPLYMPGHSVPWRDWQRREDYYPEGVLLWLDVDAHLRELSHNRIGLDDFAAAFFATKAHAEVVETYTLDDACRTLQELVSADWKAFLSKHLQTHRTPDALAGLLRAGWTLTYDTNPSDVFLQDEAEAGVVNLDTSLGAQVRPDGTVRSVAWEGAAFQSEIAPGMRIDSVNSQPFSRAVILEALSNPKNDLQLAISEGTRHWNVSVSHVGRVAYPHLQRIPSIEDRLTPLLLPR